jgi:phenylacetate-CoA ligase
LSLESRLFDVAIPAVYRLARRPQFELLRELKAHDRWEPERLRALQAEKLHKLVTHAATTVPYYRDLFARLGLAPDDIRTVDDLQALPLLTRDAVKENLRRLCSEAAPPLLPNMTGGSTGMPMRFFQTREFLDLGSAAWFRNYTWTGLPFGARKLYVWGHPNERKLARRLKGRFEHWLHRRLFLDAFALSDATIRRWHTAIIEFGAEFAYGYASALDALARMLREADLELPRLRAVMSTAERLYPHQRELLESVFGCRVYDQYGSREIWSIASQCAHGRMHVNSDLHVVELVDRGGPAQNVVLTPLDNFGMPLIRYVNDDLASPITDSCPCGLPYPTMTAVQGRTSDNFKAPDGRIIHGEYLTHLMYGIDGVRQFQFVQRAPRNVVLSVVKDQGFADTTERQLHRVATEFRACFGFPLETEFVRSISPSPSGKTRFTISMV